MIHVLITDDDPNILQLVSIYMDQEGYHVFQAKDGEEALAILEAQAIDIAIIDIMMPKLDGFALCEEIRRYYEIPVLMLTAKGETKDKVKGFQLGTDDYVVKPFEPTELVMRVKALLRRYQVQASKSLQIGNIKMETEKKEVKVDGKLIQLPLKEFDLIYMLASYPEKIFTRQQLIEKIWGFDYEGDDRTVDVHVKRIRDKLKQRNSTVSIKTIRGLGYRIEVIEA